MSTETSVMGKPVDRVDGRLKVTGQAVYAMDTPADKVAHAHLVLSTIACGRILEVDISAAEKSPGILSVLTHKNALKLQSQQPKERPVVDPQFGEPLSPLQDDRVRFNGQPVALVVAETVEQAQHAAALVKLRYHEETPVTDFATAKPFRPAQANNDQGKQRPADYKRGDPDKAYNSAEVRVASTYTIPTEHHNPIETHATLAEWNGEKLTLHDKSQWVYNVRTQVALAFDLKPDHVRVVSPFVGGAFGSALRTWWHVLLAAMAAKVVNRPVKLALSRAQMFTGPGYRPHTVQKVSLGATRDGKLTAIRHEGTALTSVYEQYNESLLNATRMLYACPNVTTVYRLAAMNVNTPTPMRAPGEVSGVFALEAAMDELAVALNLDPVELRLRNHADRDPEKDLPWSSKSLKECYQVGAERFGWARRTPKPGSMRDGRSLVGYGMASATYPFNRQPATVYIGIRADGTASVRTASSDMGPGTWTSMTQIAADVLGLPVAKVKFELGDTEMPRAPVHGGSMTMASVGSAVQEAALLARARVLNLASSDRRSPLHEATEEQVVAQDGRLFIKDEPHRGATYVEILKQAGKEVVELTHESKPGDEKKKFSMHAFAAHFVEVRVDPELGQVRVARVVAVTAAGRIINPKTSRSQLIGGIVGGIGMALLEATHRDLRNGRVVNANLADYHVPVNADVPLLETYLIEEHDPHVNPLGVKGLGEIALVGVGAAILNAVYHATGKRVRELPITPEKLL